MNLTDLDTFLRVVESGSFTRAAADLGVPKSTVSRRVARLEAELGIELLERKARSFQVTAHGRQLHARCAPALREIEAVERGLADDAHDPTGTLRVTAAPDLALSPAFAALLVRFRERYPGVTVELSVTMRSVDLIEEGLDLAFRFHGGQLPDSAALMQRRIAGAQGALYAGVDYVAQHGAPRHPEELAAHRLVTLDRAFTRHGWTLIDANGDRVELPIEPRLVVSDFTVLAQLLVAGGGVGPLPTFVADTGIRRGELTRVLPAWTSQGGVLSLLWPASRFLAPRVRAFIDHVASQGLGEVSTH